MTLGEVTSGAVGAVGVWESCCPGCVSSGVLLFCDVPGLFLPSQFQISLAFYASPINR